MRPHIYIRQNDERGLLIEVYDLDKPAYGPAHTFAVPESKGKATVSFTGNVEFDAGPLPDGT